MIHIILMEPENPGNIGAVARVMKNFGFSDLVLINPKANHLCTEARNRAKHAQDVLENAKIADAAWRKRYDLLIGTSAKHTTDYNIPRVALSPDEMQGRLTSKTGILFGREGNGLSNKEIALCDMIVTIPTADYTSLNLSHAVAVICFELSKLKNKRQPVAASRKEKDLLLSTLKARLAKMRFGSPQKRLTQEKAWQRIIGKSNLTRREFFILMGFFRKL